MSQTFQKLRERVLADRSIQEQLINVQEIDEFISELVRISIEQNLPVSAEDIRQEMIDARRSYFEEWG